MRSTAKRILKEKKPVLAEIELTLFENCNQNCAFCDHDKKSTVGLTQEEIYSKKQIVFDFIDGIDDDVRTVQVQLVGGELLQDRLIEEGHLRHYAHILNEIKKYVRKTGRFLQVMVVSNMLFQDTKKIWNWLNWLNRSFDTQLIASYDITGREINSQWRFNLEALKKYIGSVNMVATAPTIKKLLSGNCNYFDYLYGEFEIFIDTFIPDERTKKLIPSDDLYLEYLKFMSENYSSVHPLSKIVNVFKHKTPMSNSKMDCMSLNKITIFPDGTTSNCRWKRYKQEHFNTTLDYDDNSNIMLAYLNQYNCLTCDHYDLCPFRCFVQWDWKDREKSEGCVLKKWFAFLENKDWTQHLSQES